MSIKEDLETIKKNYEIRPIITFDELVETYLIQNDKEEELSKDELKKFINDHFDEINEEFTLRINAFDDGEIPFDDDERKELDNFRNTCISLDNQTVKGIGLMIDIPPYDCIFEIFLFTVAIYWKKYKNEKITRLLKPLGNNKFLVSKASDQLWDD